MEIIRLLTENRKTPYGIDTQHPVFSWNVLTEVKNWKQKSYQIYVTKDGKCVWNSGTVLSDQMVQIPYAGIILESDTRYEWKVMVEGEDGIVSESAKTWFETGLFYEKDWKGIYIGEVEDHTYHIYRNTFEVKKQVVRARMYVSGLGHHVCYLNGKQVSDRVLEPGWSDYRKTNFYSVYDITEMLQNGKNGIGVKLGDGMYNVPGGRYVYYKRSYGKMKLNIQLNLIYEDGTRESVVTDGTWRMAKSPILFCCIYGGEEYDGRLEQKGFSTPDFVEDGAWEPVVEVERPMGERRAMPIEPMRIKRIYRPVSVRKTKPGVWLYDFGTNFSGWSRIRIRRNTAKAGHEIVMTPGEILNESFEPDQRVTGRGYIWKYYLNDEEIQEFAPDFTYTGFRYVQVTGAVPDTENGKEELPIIEEITGEFIYTDVEETGQFQCSNQLFNDIHQIICQAIRSNLKSYLTDCPHRERLPWLEQTHLIAPGVMYNYDVENLYKKQEQDMADSQRENGLIPDICPEYVVFGYHEGFVDSPEWGSAVILNSWYLYQRYGNQSVMETYYENMKRYLDYLTSRTSHRILRHGLGDWLDIGPNKPYSQNTPVSVSATCIYYYDICILKQVAELLGKEEDVKELEILRSEVYREYNLQFLDNQTARYATGSQTAQAMSLVTGLVPNEYKEAAIKQLKNDIVNRNYAVTAGDVGHPFLITAALENGLSDLINEMTNQIEKPGYGFQIMNGATTLTEDWDGADREHPHGSQNHFMLGGIEEWFYGSLGGIRLLHSKRPFGEVDICPYFPKDMKQCRVRVRHPYGIISVSWKREEKKVNLKVEVPANLIAHITTEKEKVKTVGSGCWEFEMESSM
ncbi:MAG: family 78 glycoside hydrolase catalytic domain [[Ruminococcus] gnavus]|nr:family 78 glycoside hydrolase catalytic domain [Mediterraneibacter gnavus]